MELIILGLVLVVSMATVDVPNSQNKAKIPVRSDRAFRGRKKPQRGDEST